MSDIGGGRVLHVCDLCGGVDDHARHQIAGGEPGLFPPPSAAVVAAVAVNAGDDVRERLISELLDTGSSDRHMDCCRAAGCPDGSCDTKTAGAPNARGRELVAHLMSSTGGDTP